MMDRIAEFQKISEEQFLTDWVDTFGGSKEEARRIYDTIQLPQRATEGSAGYDFYTPLAFSLQPGESVKIPTGIRAKIAEGWVLLCLPRSGLGFRYRLQLNNTVGVIDSDYYHAANEGHIFVKLTNDSRDEKTVALAAQDGFAQGIFLPYGITVDDDAQEKRTGGFGSTSK